MKDTLSCHNYMCNLKELIIIFIRFIDYSLLATESRNCRNRLFELNLIQSDKCTNRKQ